MSILRVTIRSSGPTDYSTEQLRLRLREAVANMEVNEQMEVLENNRRRQRRAADSVQLTRRSHPVPPPLLPVRRSSSSSSSADSNNNINISPVSSSSHHSQISSKTQYPSAVTSVRKNKKTLPLLSQHSPLATAPARVPTCSGAMVTVPKKKDVQLPVLTSYRNGEPAARRRRRPGTDSVDDDGDEGEYCIRKSRRETRTGNDWEVTRKNHYSYWPPKKTTTTATTKRGFIS